MERRDFLKSAGMVGAASLLQPSGPGRVPTRVGRVISACTPLWPPIPRQCSSNAPRWCTNWMPLPRWRRAKPWPASCSPYRIPRGFL
ncbi:MAG: twin-arginine translocation signal domain-containing protein [Candidatus Handelsmanbacteria bacterium]|nr:twin-arginine translocation signal domain-containing protein [Candidatus Handelsmanbacteria bacterium]